jgi:ferredoxin
MRIIADRDRCIGSGQCVLSLPEMFDQSERDGRVLVSDARPDPGDFDDARTAVRLCPSRALSLAED